MSLYVTLEINDARTGTVAITRTTSHGEQPDAVNFYRWQYWRDGESAVGHIEHRYGDGAVVLAAKVLAEVAERHQLAQVMTE